MRLRTWSKHFRHILALLHKTLVIHSAKKEKLLWLFGYFIIFFVVITGRGHAEACTLQFSLYISGTWFMEIGLHI